MRANDCQHYHVGHCRAPDVKHAANRGCVLLDCRVSRCLWFAPGADRPVGRPHKNAIPGITIPIFKDLK